ncbi:MAG: redox-sensing transcriptional repressor Rex [Spirochaetales bacterium]|nr:redox-sensing transcriptional repressor Rex [Spirochaetales bacterium]
MYAENKLFKNLPEQYLKRIPFYHQILSELALKNEAYVSSRYLAGFFNVDETQIRKDISLTGYKGKPKYGYSVQGLKEAIEAYLGINYHNTAVLFGAGKLGTALIEYEGLADYGLEIIAVFDNNPVKIGSPVGHFNILSPSALPRVIRSFDIGIAILTVPKTAAQEVCDQVTAMGIKAIWNFAPLQLSVGMDVILRNENLAAGAALLSYYLKKSNHRQEGP